MIQFTNIGKLYRLGQVGTGTLCHDLNRWWQTRVLHHDDPYQRLGMTNRRDTHGTSDFVWALQGISFTAQPGEVLGIIGKNGAGKSTLLKLLSRVTAPTTGTIRATGRIASLLEVGTGFHAEMTGRENIYMNGTIMGMRKRAIDAKLDEIVDFAGVELYLDTPVKRYSSGMWVRLGFAVAAFLEPDILVVDEVLAVGDAEFQRKAIGKMRDVASDSGRTVLFVSHNMASVRSLCTRGLLLTDGTLTLDGPVDDVISQYLGQSTATTHKRIIDNISCCRESLHVRDLRICGTTDTLIPLSADQRDITVSISATTEVPIKGALKIVIKSPQGAPLATCEEGTVKGTFLYIPAGDFTLEQTFRLPDYLSQGDYHIDFILHQPMAEDFMRAMDCAILQSPGVCDRFARPLSLRDQGLCHLPVQSTNLVL